MSEEIPSTHEEVRRLVESAPPPEQTQALLEVVKGRDFPLRSVTAMKWLCLTMALLIVSIALVTVFKRNQDLTGRADAAAVAAECRELISGKLLIAKAHGIEAGNNYNAVLGDALIGALEQRNTPEVLAELNKQLTVARDRLRTSGVEMQAAIDNQERVLELC